MKYEHINSEEFVSMAYEILKKFGSEQNNLMTQGLAYEDNIIRITQYYNGLDLEVKRKPIIDENHSELRVSNPVTMVAKGDIIRHHGEHCYLVPHMKSILGIKNENEATAGMNP